MYFIFNDLIGLVWIAWMLMSHDQLPAEDVAMSLSLAQSGQIMSSPSVMNPFPAIES